jgi:cell division protein ZapA
VKNETEISIFGQSYVVRGDDPEYIREVAAYVDGKMRELFGEPSQGLTTRGAVLAALNIADEFFKYRKELEAFREEVESRSRAMLKLLR